MKKAVISIHMILIALELTALVHDLRSFGLSIFKYYTIDSNILQLFVSAMIVYWLLYRRGRDIPAWLSIIHLVCAVCLTITFLIALLVLAPQEGFAYYFLENVAPINHFIGPLLSVVTFLFMEKSEPLPRMSFAAPAAVSLLYGAAALVLNYLRLLDGPYFFLRVHDEPVGIIAMWFGIITVLCLTLSAVYLWLKNKKQF